MRVELPDGPRKVLWRVTWKVWPKPVEVIELENGFIKVVGSCLIQQKRDQAHESYHDTQKEAVMRFLVDRQRDVNQAKKDLLKAQNRLKSARSKWTAFCSG